MLGDAATVSAGAALSGAALSGAALSGAALPGRARGRQYVRKGSGTSRSGPGRRSAPCPGPGSHTTIVTEPS